MTATRWLDKTDLKITRWMARWGPPALRVSLGVVFIWFGILKPLGMSPAQELVERTVYWIDPAVFIPLLGWWEVAIGVCLLIRPLVRVAILLLVLRLPGVILAFILKPDVCFFSFPFAPTPEGQYLIKDLVIFIATLAIMGALHDPGRTGQIR